jgi:acyl-CoA dehydrogenase
MSTYFDIDLGLTEEDKAIKEQAHKFSRDVLRPVGRELDRMAAKDVVAENSPLFDVMKQAYALGYHKAGFPEEVGGLGCTPLQTHIIWEELYWGNLGLASCVSLAGWPYIKLLGSGNQQLIEEFVIPYCACTDGSITGCWAITEPDHGSDTMNVGEKFFSDASVRGQLQARLDGDEYVLHGQKSAWVSCAPFASHGMVNVNIDPEQGLSGGGVCILPLNLPGVKRGAPLEKVGQRDLPQGELFFDNVRIPKDWMFITPANYVETGVLGNLGFGNTCMSIVALGIARAAFEEAFSWAKQRIQGGKPLAEHYAMKIRLHKMFTNLEAIRAMSRAVWQLNLQSNPLYPEYGFAAKTFCTDTARLVIEEAVQIYSANGLTKEYYIEKLWRDSRALTIEDGENNTLNNIGGHVLNQTYPRL